MNDGGLACGFSVRACQRTALCAMLALPEALRPCAWKLAVFDARGGEILALCLRAGDVARCGVTLAQRLEDATRPRVPGVPCVYFVAPTPETLDLVARELAPRGLYTAGVVCARGAADTATAAALAEALHRHGAAPAFRALTAQHTDFLSLSDTVFVTGSDGCDDDGGAYRALHDRALDERGAAALVAAIAARLCDVVATLGVVPVIRAQAGTAAADIAARLHALLQQHLADASNGSNGSNGSAGKANATSFRRPLLVLFDRDYDLGGALAHAWSYGGLVRQLFASRLNRTTVPPHEHYLDCDADPLWRRLAPLPFPDASDALNQEVRSYRDDAERVRARATADVDDLEDSTSTSTTTSTSGSVAAAQMAEHAAALRERKAHIDAHLETVAAVLRAVDQRRLCDLHELGRELLRCTGVAPPTPALTRKVRDAVIPPAAPPAATPEGDTGSTTADRLRLYLVWLLANSAESLAGTNAADARDMAAALAREDSRAATAIAHVRRTKAFLDQAAAVSPGASPAASPVAAPRSTLLHSVVHSLTRAGAPAAPEGSGRAVRAFAAMMAARDFGDDRAFVTLDPRQPAGSAGAAAQHRRTAFRDGIFFVVGGGSYAEHEDLCRTLCAPDGSGAAPVRVLYGATEMVRPDDLLATFAALG